ncbi:MAG: aminoacyl-tRNA hydrolase [Acidimicrobiia bacterium]|nr:aminoacyl-tRNA hydrolase [Acidimicrobiia bacterium]
MNVIVGLHNPESQYLGTRHNVGAEVVDEVARRWDLPFKRGPLRVRSMVARGSVAGEPVILVLPNANMNLSGQPVSAVLKYFKASLDELLLCHDDIDLPYAKLRLVKSSGAGGHNGVKSVASAVGSQEFWRLKLGVGRPPGRMDPAAFVLKPFSKAERPEIDVLVRDAADVVERFLTDPSGAVQMAGERRPPEPVL